MKRVSRGIYSKRQSARPEPGKDFLKNQERDAGNVEQETERSDYCLGEKHLGNSWFSLKVAGTTSTAPRKEDLNNTT